MNKESFVECERKQFGKLITYRFPNKFMYVGLAIAALSIIAMFIRAFAMDGDTEWLKTTLQKTLLISMLLMSISKDKREDEMTISLRAQSYAIAFIVGVIYALVMPYVDYGVSNALKPEPEVLKDLGDFQVLLFMLMIQLMFYHNLKRYR